MTTPPASPDSGRIPEQNPARAPGPDSTSAPPVLCPFCGLATPAAGRCAHCRGTLDPLSRQASQNAMGPWFIRDEKNPFRPGCSYETIVGLIKRGKIDPLTVLRGPTTRQFWSLAKRTPGVAHFLGMCHSCQADVQPNDRFCDECGSSFEVETDRQHLGLAPVILLPGQASPEAVANSVAAATAAERAALDSPEDSRIPHHTDAVSTGLNEAAAVRRVMERRLKSQTRVTALVTLALLLALSAGLFIAYRLSERGLLTTIWTRSDSAALSDNSGARHFAAPPAAPATTPSGPEVEPAQSIEPAPIAKQDPSPAPPPTPAADTPKQSPEQSKTSPPPANLDAVKLADLIRKDTRESLTQALEMLKTAGVSEQSAGQIRITRAGIERRIDQLRLKGLP